MSINVPGGGTSTASNASTNPAANTANINLTQLDAAIVNTGYPLTLVAEHTPITNAFTTNWNLGDPKEKAAFVKALDPNNNWKWFTIGTTTAIKLLVLVQDKASLFSWDTLLRVPTDSTGQIAVSAKILANSSKIYNAGFTKVVNLAMNYTSVTTEHCQYFGNWYDRDDTAKLTNA